MAKQFSILQDYRTTGTGTFAVVKKIKAEHFFKNIAQWDNFFP